MTISDAALPWVIWIGTLAAGGLGGLLAVAVDRVSVRLSVRMLRRTQRHLAQRFPAAEADARNEALQEMIDVLEGR